MKWSVLVKANAKVEKVEQVSGLELKVFVKAPAKEGRANQAVIEVLSRHFKRPQSHFQIVRGHGSKHKVIEAI